MTSTTVPLVIAEQVSQFGPQLAGQQTHRATDLQSVVRGSIGLSTTSSAKKTIASSSRVRVTSDPSADRLLWRVGS
jgi:hypothetical protein